MRLSTLIVSVSAVALSWIAADCGGTIAPVGTGENEDAALLDGAPSDSGAPNAADVGSDGADATLLQSDASDASETTAPDAADAGSEASDANVSDASAPDAADAGSEASDANVSDASAPDAADAGSEAPDANISDANISDANATGAADSGDANADAAQACAPATATGSSAVTYQIDVAHTGAQPGDALLTPLCQRWSRDLGGYTSYALVAGGRVFVTVSLSSGAELLALDEHTGETLWGPAALGGDAWGWSNAAYDNGRVFAANSEGTLYAFDANSEIPVWSVALPGQYLFSSPPTALDGFVYLGGAGSGGTVYAVDEANGGVAWTQSVENGDDSSPAISGSDLYVSYACNQAYDFALATGAPVWHFSGPCEGGGGKTVAVYNGRVYTRDDTEGNLILDAADGGQVGTFSAEYIPAFSAGVGYFVTVGGALQAIPVGSATASWSFTASDPVITEAIVVGSLVVVATSSTLYALSTSDGLIVSSTALASAASSDEDIDTPLAGLTAADGMLFVTTLTGLVAY